MASILRLVATTCRRAENPAGRHAELTVSKAWPVHPTDPVGYMRPLSRTSDHLRLVAAENQPIRGPDGSGSSLAPGTGLLQRVTPPGPQRLAIGLPPPRTLPSITEVLAQETAIMNARRGAVLPGADRLRSAR